MKTKIYFFILLTLLFYLADTLQAQQQTITISAGSDWEDAVISKNTLSGYEYVANANYGNYIRIGANAWTHSGNPTYRRTLIRFSLEHIPTGSTVNSAVLYLYSDPSAGGAWDQNSQLSGSNAFFLEKITQAWDESVVTWNTQPSTTSTGRIWVGASTSTNENRQVNIASLVQGWVNDPANNFGMKMLLENEAYWRARTYASSDHSNSSLRPKLVITYTPPSTPLSDRLDYIFGWIDKSQVPTGFLEEYGAALIPLDVFNGVLSDSNRVDENVWRMAYGSLQSSRIYGSNPLPNLYNVNSEVERFSGGAAVPVMMLFAEYNYLRPDAVSANLLTIENDQLFDVVGRPTSPYNKRLLFAASPANNYSAQDGSVSLIFKPELFFNASPKSINAIAIDFDDGRGYINASWNTPVSATYSSAGLKQLKIRATFSDGSVMQCYADMEVKSSVVAARYDPNNPDMEALFPRTTTHSGGRVFVRFDRNNAERTIDKPLIVVEGYDVHAIAPKLQDNYGYEDFINSMDNAAPFDFNGHLDDIAGYDLIFLDYNNGADDIRRNAELLIEVINWVNNEKVGSEQNVVMGISMGGLVARYALAKMTKGGANPETRLLITHDSPHRGANTPIGLQSFVRAVAGMDIMRGLNTLNVFPSVKQANAVLNAPATRQLLILRDAGAAAIVGFYVNNTFLAGEYRNMITFPAPGPQPAYRMIATSLGSECGLGSLAPGSRLLTGNGRHFISPVPWISRVAYKVDAFANALPNYGVSDFLVMKFRVYIQHRILGFVNINLDLTNKQAYAPPYTLPWDGVGGGTQNVTDYSGNFPDYKIRLLPFIDLSLGWTAAEDFCFVPTASALDVKTISLSTLADPYTWGISPGNNSRLATFVTQEQNTSGTIFNETHPIFTSRNAEWLFREMENQNNPLHCTSACVPENFAISGPAALSGGENGIYASNTSLADGYTISWSKSSNLVYVSGQNTLNYRVRAASGASGSAWVEARLTGSCGVLIDRKNINIGLCPIPSQQIHISGNEYVCPNSSGFYYQLYNSSNAPILQYNWQLPTGWQIDSQYDYPNSGTVYVSTGPSVDLQTIEVSFQTECGWQGPWYFTVNQKNNCFPYNYAVAPNPADNLIEVAETDRKTESINAGEEKLYSNTILELLLYNNQQKLLKKIPYRSPSTLLDTSDLQPGHYILHIVKKEGVDQRHIVIQRE